MNANPMVPYLDVEAGRIVRIPASELRPGTVQARLQGHDELVWVLPEQLRPSPIRHPEFEESVRDVIREIHATFAEHRGLTLEEWEEGFRRDAHPENEIALWSHAADVYRAFAHDEPSAERRFDIYLCIIACLTASPEEIWHVLRPEALSREEAAAVIARFHRDSES